MLLSVLCGLVLSFGFFSCSDDDSEDWSWKEGSKVELPRYRAFVLTEGTFNHNNSHLTFLDPAQDTIYTRDIYEAQNGIKLGDTANDMIEHDGDILSLIHI